MPDDKRADKRNNPKEQRRPRHGRQHPTAEKKVEKQADAPKPVRKEIPKPEYEPPGPEFYKNLKRETDEILKITEEENAKYKKKEIQSNWSKYELPIESYEEIEEQENMGADYEKLIQAPLVVGGHFQFKHEKSWDLNTAPSLYDKYFDINMDNLNLALSTIPFYDRNCIDKSIFSETDILSMDNRSTRFKQKYYNDKTYSTPEMEASDKILQSLSDNNDNENSTEINLEEPTKDAPEKNNTTNIENTQEPPSANILVTNVENKSTTDSQNLLMVKEEVTLSGNNESIETVPVAEREVTETEVTEKLNLKLIPPKESSIEETNLIEQPIEVPNDKIVDDFIFGQMDKELSIPNVVKVEDNKTLKDTEPKKEPKKTAVIESPEDLEKWLDDFLDG